MAKTTDWTSSLMWALAAAAAILLSGCGEGSEASANGVDAESSTPAGNEAEPQTPEPSTPATGGDNPFNFGGGPGAPETSSGGTPGATSGNGSTSGGANPFDNGSGATNTNRSSSQTPPNTNTSNPFDNGNAGTQNRTQTGNASNPFDNGGTAGRTPATTGGGNNPFDQGGYTGRQSTGNSWSTSGGASGGNSGGGGANPFDTPNASNTNRAQNVATQTAPRPTIFRKHQVTDPNHNGMVANTVLVPENWKVEGGITPGSNQLWYNPFFHDVKYIAPDGRQLHFFPSLSFEFTAQAMHQGAQLFQPINGNLYYPLPETPGKWIMELVRKNPDPDVTNVRLVSEEPEPTLTRQLQQQSAMMYQSAQQLQQTGAQLGMGAAFDTQATVVKLRYVENGVELEESILMAWQYFVNYSQGQMTGGKWAVPLMISLRGPAGTDYMNDPELLTVAQSLRINPQWQAEMNRYWQQLARIHAKGAADRNRQWQAHNAKMQQYREDTNAIIAGGYAKRSAMREAGFEKQIDGIREVSPYNIGGETVKIPDYYDNVHTDGNGRYILSNDFHYNPNRDLNLPGNWTKVQPQR